MPSIMQASLATDYGDPDVLQIGEAPRPEPQAGEVLIQVKSAGVNPADWKYRSGIYKQFMPLAFPWTPGLDGAGIVAAIGPDVTAFKVGDAVLGVFQKSYAEYATAPASGLTFKPSNISFDQAASIPVGALTAWGAVIDTAKVEHGQKVLVHGGAGGVGIFAVQLARWKGAHVTATASAANLDFVRSLGAETVIDYTTTKFEGVVKDQDVVIDTVGGDLHERSFGVLRKGGIFVTVAGRLGEGAGQAQGVRATNAGRAAPDKLAELADLVASGTFKTAIYKVFPLDQAADAHALSQTGHSRGRIVLHIAD